MITEETRTFMRLPFAAITDDIDRLRQIEAHYQRGNIEMDRLQRALVSAHPANLVILVGMPPGSWAPLPQGWQTKQQLALTPRWPPIPEDIKGPVAVSAELAKEMTK